MASEREKYIFKYFERNNVHKSSTVHCKDFMMSYHNGHTWNVWGVLVQE